jgi:hypothetical protein
MLSTPQAKDAEIAIVALPPTAEFKTEKRYSSMVYFFFGVTFAITMPSSLNFAKMSSFDINPKCLPSSLPVAS